MNCMICQRYQERHQVNWFANPSLDLALIKGLSEPLLSFWFDSFGRNVREISGMGMSSYGIRLDQH